MRKVLGIIIMLLAVVMFVSCSSAMDRPQKTATTGRDKPGAATSVMDVLGDDMLAIYKNRDTKLPAAVIYIYQGNGVRVESPLYGDDDVNAALDAIAQITIAGETDITVADSDSCYTFLNADGTEAGSVSFNGKFLDCGDVKYIIENKKALAAMDFPAETERNTLTVDGPDPRMYEFLEKCKTEEPVRPANNSQAVIWEK